MMPRRSAHGRSFVVIAVLVVTASALFIATGALFMAQAEIAGVSGAGAAAQSRATAWSGMQVIIGELNAQRDAILEGELPRLDEQYTIYEAGGRIGVIRLLVVTAAGERLAAESGKIDLNHATAEQLVATEMIEESVANSIVAHRDSLGRPMQSIEELLSVPGVTPEMFYGPLDEMRIMDEARGGESDLNERVLARLGTEEPRGLVDVLTVFSFGPPLQRDGRLRINLNVEWSDELASRLDDRFGEGTSQIVKRLIDEGTAFDSERRIVEVLRFFEVEPEEWIDILDALRVDDHEFYFGRLNINTAPEAALHALPDITAEQAADMVRSRDGLSAEHRQTIVWPLLSGILEAEQYDELVNRMTVRSWTYRVRIAAGEVNAEEPEGELLGPIVWEAVIDLAAPKPRIAYLRDVTMLQTAAVIAANASLGLDDEYDWDEQWMVDDVEQDIPPEDAAAPGSDFDDEVEAENDPVGEGDADPEEDEQPSDGSGQRVGRWKPS